MTQFYVYRLLADAGLAVSLIVGPLATRAEAEALVPKGSDEYRVVPVEPGQDPGERALVVFGVQIDPAEFDSLR